MPKLSVHVFWGIGYPKLSARDRELQARELGALPRSTRLLAGLSLLLPAIGSIAAILLFLGPSLEAFEQWFGLPPSQRVIGLQRVLVLTALMVAIAALIGAVWCLVTSMWVKLAAAKTKLPPLALEAIARGRYFG
jgi:hypothetical protein